MEAYAIVMEYAITSKEQLKELWTNIYNTEGKPDWSHIIPYYDDDIYFRDTVQEIHGKREFTAMTERLVKRSGSLEMEVRNAAQDDNVIFLEWIMTMKFRSYPKSSIYGSSRITLNDAGKIIEQRDYYDLWGDIFNHIPGFGRVYRIFMRMLFG
jgi:limonene-1,2-epoxide hydrolase